ncbi:HD family phosphohydrolase [Clostridium tarantellae]|uniref:HDIG domain-containing protein n=1 Tax=Clostridium tarantellae TaxID=39493 RepID=A0A6I1MGD2_9CLOT|nr:HDIG domain-containing metalloprotein [Clostridium tarantellae]MPQ42240.1 HDIG domain-containing protein [Clostridium tarantellae]
MRKILKTVSGMIADYRTIILYIITFIIIYTTLATALVTKKYDLSVGDIPKIDIKAQREIIDESATEARKKEAIDKVDKQYSLKTDVEKQSLDSIKIFFNKLLEINGKEIPLEDKIKLLINENSFKLTDNELGVLLSLNKDEITKTEQILNDAITKAYENPIEEQKEQELEKARRIALDVIYNSSINNNVKEILNKISFILIKSNFFYDKEKTDELVKETLKNISPIVIKKNQIIVKEGEPVTAHQLQLLNSLGLLNESKFNLYIYVSLAVVVFLVLYLQYWYLYKNYKRVYYDFPKLIMISLVNIMAIILSRVFSSISFFLIPVICSPILLTLLLNYKLSLIFSILNLILIAGVVGFNPNIIAVSLVSIILSATSLKKMQQRNDILYLSIGVAAISSILCLGISTLSTNNFVEVLVDSLFVAGGAILGGVLAIGVLPFFESTFDVVTTVKLLELSNPNHPLLKKLLMEAPGTYHHSVLVANLAELATEEIGGNPLLARIGAFYHDVGKTKRPYFFRENQIGKENPHDKINPKLSAHIIISHVKDGLELAKEYNVPKVISDFIASHHGDTLVKYFYLTVKNNAKNPEDVKEEDFKYSGPKPESKEQGVLMLADSVEAAVRSINDPSKEKINEMVNNIIKDKLNSGQLDNCELTLKDIDKIKKCFLKALHGIYHERIEYPTENIKKENK